LISGRSDYDFSSLQLVAKGDGTVYLTLHGKDNRKERDVAELFLPVRGLHLLQLYWNWHYLPTPASFMNKSIELPDSVFVPEPDIQTIQRLEAMLSQVHPKLVGMDGEEIPLPDSVYQALRQVIHLMAAGRVISLVPYDCYLSSQEAADLLNVSRPYLYALLEKEQIPYIMVGTHRRIRFEDLMDYKQRRDNQRRQALSELAAESQDLGFYAAVDRPPTENS
jgi:excisionase family DNA binding protein